MVAELEIETWLERVDEMQDKWWKSRDNKDSLKFIEKCIWIAQEMIKIHLVRLRLASSSDNPRSLIPTARDAVKKYHEEK